MDAIDRLLARQGSAQPPLTDRQKRPTAYWPELAWCLWGSMSLQEASTWLCQLLVQSLQVKMSERVLVEQGRV